MDIKEYIQSGMIEQYVLGLATAEDVAELEQLRVQYPEINDAVLNFEKNFEAYLLANPVQPPASVKSSLETKLFGELSADKTSDEHITPVYKMSVWRYIAAASIIL